MTSERDAPRRARDDVPERHIPEPYLTNAACALAAAWERAQDRAAS